MYQIRALATLHAGAGKLGRGNVFNVAWNYGSSERSLRERRQGQGKQK